MDVRLSAEQRALRDSVAQVVGHLGPATVGALDDAERTAKLDAAVAAAGWRELRSADDTGNPWASGVEVAVIDAFAALFFDVADSLDAGDWLLWHAVGVGAWRNRPPSEGDRAGGAVGAAVQAHP